MILALLACPRHAKPDACFADGVNDCWPVYSDWYGCG